MEVRRDGSDNPPVLVVEDLPGTATSVAPVRPGLIAAASEMSFVPGPAQQSRSRAICTSVLYRELLGGRTNHSD